MLYTNVHPFVSSLACNGNRTTRCQDCTCWPQRTGHECRCMPTPTLWRTYAYAATHKAIMVLSNQCPAARMQKGTGEERYNAFVCSCVSGLPPFFATASCSFASIYHCPSISVPPPHQPSVGLRTCTRPLRHTGVTLRRTFGG